MGIYTDDTTILGVRILVETPINSGDYYVKYEFIGDNWKYNASKILPHFLNQNDVKIQTLHPFSTSYNLTTGQTMEPGNIWLDNHLFRLENLAI